MQLLTQVLNRDPKADGKTEGLVAGSKPDGAATEGGDGFFADFLVPDAPVPAQETIAEQNRVPRSPIDLTVPQPVGQAMPGLSTGDMDLPDSEAPIPAPVIGGKAVSETNNGTGSVLVAAVTAPVAGSTATEQPVPPTPEVPGPGDLSSQTKTVALKDTLSSGVSNTPGPVPQAVASQAGETVTSSERELRARNTAPAPGTIASEGVNQKAVQAAAAEIGKTPSADSPAVAAPVAVAEEGPVERVAKPVRSTPESVAVKGQMTVANSAPQPSNLSLGQVGTPVSGSENSNPGAVNRVDAPRGDLGPEEAARPAPAPAPPSPLPPAAATMPERLVLSKAAKGSRSDPAPEVTVTVTNSTEAAEQPRAQQIAVGLAPGKDQGNSGGGFGSEGRLAREETLPPLTPTDRPEAKRGAEAVSAVRNDPAARPVLTQLVQAARSAIDGMVEVKLSPEELGRVRMTMSGSDAGLGMNVIVTAERPETLDLIRRNIDLFAADLAEQGFTDLNFSFGGDMTGGEGDDSGGESGQTASSQAPQSVFEARIDSSNVASDGRVDLRL